MGIPSYYKKWIDTCPGLVQLLHPSVRIDWLFMDFNCLIYQCIQQSTMSSYHEDTEEEWEEDLLDHVEEYTKKVIRYVQPVMGVYLAVDGVVPMAKMRQQRLRRFKSQWMAKKEGRSKWDTNAITPGTPFMEKLHKRLEQIQKHSSLPQFIISNSNEPGEGEHKLMSYWRKDPHRYSGDLAIYGLDADLIILSLLSRLQLQHTRQIWLFREQMEKGKGVHDPVSGEECFEWFGIHALHKWLSQRLGDTSTGALFSYCFVMSILGNDFLPRSLHLTLREDGHEELLQALQYVIQHHGSLVNEQLQIQSISLFSFFQFLKYFLFYFLLFLLLEE
jgi:5'-3' exonuclease